VKGVAARTGTTTIAVFLAYRGWPSFQAPLTYFKLRSYSHQATWKIRILIIIITVLDTYFLRELCEAERVQVIPIQYLHRTGRASSTREIRRHY
jgi:hypothetical protein